MKVIKERLNALRTEMTAVTKDFEKGKLTSEEAADRIIHIRQEMDELVQRLKNMSKPK
jgi:predicted  nucleic acid-binding Zn-ribbon protein